MRKFSQVLGHWHTTFESFDFYELVKLASSARETPDLTISEVEWKESGLGSGKRVYLRAAREGLSFPIYTTPGRGVNSTNLY